MKVKSLSRVRLLATPGTAAYQAPPSMGFARFLSRDSLKELNKCAKRYGKQCEILNLSYVCACGVCGCVCVCRERDRHRGTEAAAHLDFSFKLATFCDGGYMLATDF